MGWSVLTLSRIVRGWRVDTSFTSSVDSTFWRPAGSRCQTTSASSLVAMSARDSARPTDWKLTFSISGGVPRHSSNLVTRIDAGSSTLSMR